MGSQGRWAARPAWRASWASPSGLVRDRADEADQLLLGTEETFAALADGAHVELVVDYQEGGRFTGESVTGAGQDHAHSTAGADAAAQLGTPGLLARVPAARAETDRRGLPSPAGVHDGRCG